MELLIGDIFGNAARAVPDRIAAVLGDDSLTFGELDRRANQVARLLESAGVKKADRVAVWSATSLDMVPLFAALAKSGAVFAPVNPALSVEEAAAVMRSARPALVAVDGDREAQAGHLGLPSLRIDGLVSGALAGSYADDGVRAPGLRESDPHVIFFTSGSTGRPKGVVLSHRVNLLRTHPGALLEPRGALVCPYPLFHMGAWTLALQQWQARDRVVFVAPDAAAICDAVQRHRATRLNCIPAVWRRVLAHLATPAEQGLDLSSLRFADTGTSETPIELLEAISAAFPNASLRVFYGSTEAGSVALLEHADFRRKPGSCGVPAPYTEVSIDPDGELAVRGPLLFDGYFDDPDATGEALRGGWYRTGDMADVDDEGYLAIVGRTRDVIRTGGETVAPAEVETVLAGAFPDVAVVGLPDPQWGEVVCAVVVLASGQPAPSVEDVRAICDGHLAPYKHPRRVAVVGAIPRTQSTQQVMRRLLVEQLS